MMNRLNFSLKIGLSLWLILFSFTVQAVNLAVIKKETTKYLIDIQYPQGFQSSEINSVLKKFIDSYQANFLNELSEDKDTPLDAPGKTSLNIRYSLPYESKAALSVRFDASIFHRGAAHPYNTITVVNFVNGHQVTLSDLFNASAEYLKPISDVCYKQITAKNNSDETWIKEGTKPTKENYKSWYFTKKGLNIVFNSTQVAAYAEGEQIVEIPLAVISSLLKPTIINAVWGN